MNTNDNKQTDSVESNKRKKILVGIVIIAVIVACIGGYAGCSKTEKVDNMKAVSAFEEENEDMLSVESKVENSIQGIGEVAEGVVDTETTENESIEDENAKNTETVSEVEGTIERSSSGNSSGSKSSSNSSSSSSGSNSSSSKSSNSSTSETTHTHNWVTVPAVTHQEDQGYDEEYIITPEKTIEHPGTTYVVCGCGKRFLTIEELQKHQTSYYDVGDFSHPSNCSYDTVGAWTEVIPAVKGTRHVEKWVTVTDTPSYQKCSICGATK